MAKGWHNEPRRHSLASKGVKTVGSAMDKKVSLDLKKYDGVWFDVGHYPQSFQKGCVDSKAKYELIGDEELRITNTCKKKDGSKTSIKGLATVKDEDELKVSFFPFVKSPYKVEWVSKNYDKAIVGHPKKKNLWYLSRTKKISPQELGSLNKIAKSKGYKPKKIVNKKVE